MTIHQWVCPACGLLYTRREVEQAHFDSHVAEGIWDEDWLSPPETPCYLWVGVPLDPVNSGIPRRWNQSVREVLLDWHTQARRRWDSWYYTRYPAAEAQVATIMANRLPDTTP